MRKLNSFNNRRGQGLVEYIIIVASVAMISLVAVSIFGHKVADQYAIGAGMLPGAHTADNAPIVTGFFAGVTEDATGNRIANGDVSWGNVVGQPIAPGGLNNNLVGVTPGDEGDAFVAD